MARTLDFVFGGSTIPCSMEKVDRNKLYGYKSSEILTADGEICTLVTLASDGKTLIPAGGVALASLSRDGKWLEKSDLKPVDLEGVELVPVESSFKTGIELNKTVCIDEYLSHTIRSVYMLDSEGGIPNTLVEELKKGTIYQFDYSYRGGIQANAAFLLAGEDGTVWMAVGEATKIEFISFEQVAVVAEEEENDEDEEDMDFGMM
jgi:hypothetical protein